MTNVDILKERRELWLECLCGEDKHSISNQLYNLSWDLNIYLILNESRRYASKTETGELKQNSMLHNYLDRMFVENSLLKIRRLTDDYKLNSESKTDKKNSDVYSIISLLNDIINQSELFTRENVFLIENLEYDISKLENIKKQKIENRILKGKGFYWDTIENHPLENKERHKSLDFLFKTNSENRKKSDKYEKVLITEIRDKIKDKVANVKIFADKLIVHSSTPESRSIKINEVSIQEIVNIYILLANVANFIRVYILNEKTIDNLVSPNLHFNIFEYLDEPIVQIENIENLSKKWNEYQDEYISKDIILNKKYKTIDEYIKNIFI